LDILMANSSQKSLSKRLWWHCSGYKTPHTKEQGQPKMRLPRYRRDKLSGSEATSWIGCWARKAYR
jgi:hypothetical protein